MLCIVLIFFVFGLWFVFLFIKNIFICCCCCLTTSVLPPVFDHQQQQQQQQQHIFVLYFVEGRGVLLVCFVFKNMYITKTTNKYIFIKQTNQSIKHHVLPQNTKQKYVVVVVVVAAGGQTLVVKHWWSNNNNNK